MSGADIDRKITNLQNFVGLPGPEYASYPGDPNSIAHKVQNLEMVILNIKKELDETRSIIEWVKATHPEVLLGYVAIQNLKKVCDESET